PSGEAPRRIRALFRDADTAILTEGGAEVLNAVPTLQARRDQLAGLCPGGLVDLADGRRFRALAPMDGGNPDPGGMVTILRSPPSGGWVKDDALPGIYMYLRREEIRPASMTRSARTITLDLILEARGADAEDQLDDMQRAVERSIAASANL
ncbi:hypothetical protein JMM61_21390, partial [Rhodovulum sulfidophilum]|uniref:head-tail joining protein n=1 Tax=Rhodovulum sulfidophilum TaxID=35806 RepID=UPI001926A17B